MTRWKRRLLWGGGFLAVTLGLGIAARCAPDFWYGFYTEFSRQAMQALGKISGLVPFCLWQVLLIAGVIGALAGLIWCLRDRRLGDWFAGLFEGLSLAALLFVGVWGLNYFGPSLGVQIGLERDRYTPAQLRQAAAYYARQASEASLRVERDSDGAVVMPSLEEMSRAAGEAYERLGEQEPRFAGTESRVKPLLFSKAFGYMGITGVFFGLTGEPGVSTETYPLSLPFTICHELGHSLAIAPEDEANYAAFLACRASADPLLRYSGYYNAFIYCSNALWEIDREGASALWGLCSQEMVRDSRVHVEYNRQFEGAVQEAAQAANDAYLKAFQQEEGTRSYGLVADYLIADWLAVTKE